MSKNKSNNIIVAVILMIFVLFAGWALVKTGENQNNGTNNDFNSLVGKPLAVQLSDKDGNHFSLDSYKGKNVVLFFNEGVICYPACWNQVAQFGTDARFNSTDTAAFSVVVDDAQRWQEAISQMPDLAKATILFDKNGTESRRLGLLSVPSSMHKGIAPGHTYIVLDKQGIVRYVYDDPTMTINNDQIFEKISAFK